MQRPYLFGALVLILIGVLAWLFQPIERETPVDQQLRPQAGSFEVSTRTWEPGADNSEPSAERTSVDETPLVIANSSSSASSRMELTAVHAGKAVEGVRLMAAGQTLGITDAQGQCPVPHDLTLRLGLGDPLWIEAQAAGLGGGLLVDPLATQAKLELGTLLAPAIEGRVRTDDGHEFLADAEVILGEHRAMTGRDGRFRLSAPSSKAEALEVRMDGLRLARFTELNLTEPLDLPVGWGSRLKVWLSTGQPAESFELRLFGQDGPRLIELGGQSGELQAAPVVFRWVPEKYDGYTLIASVPGHGPVVRELPQPLPAEVLLEALPSKGRRVHLPALAGTGLEVRALGILLKSGAGVEETATLDANGIARFGNLDGTSVALIRVSAALPASWGALNLLSATVEFDETGMADLSQLRFDPLRVEIQHPKPAPLLPARLQLRMEPEQQVARPLAYGNSLGAPRVQELWIPPGESLELMLPRGNVELEALYFPDHSRSTAAVRLPDAMRAVLTAPSSSLNGLLRLSRAGHPLEARRALLVQRDGQNANRVALSDSRGRLRISAPEPGRYALYVEGDEGLEGATRFEFELTETNFDLEFEVPAPARVGLRSGHPWNLSALPLDRPGNFFAVDSMEAEPGEIGLQLSAAGNLLPLSPGRWQLTLTREPSGERYSLEVDLSSGELLSIDPQMLGNPR